MTSSSPRRIARSLARTLLATFAIGRPHGGRRRPSARSGSPSRPASRRFRAATAAASAGACLLAVAGTQLAGAAAAGAATRAGSGTGWSIPFSGAPQYEYLAPTEATNASQINQPIGQRVADEIARKVGLRKADTFTERQYLEFISGRGIGGNRAAAALVDRSVQILTNTTGRPLHSVVDGVLTPTVLASYGLFVNVRGLLESPANAHAPTRIVNTVIAPGGYMGKWMRANGATRSLIQLYRSAYTVETAYGFVAQQISGAAQLVTNTRDGVSTEVGMSMAPALWIVNFTLIYTLNPALAADMPAYWAPIPATVARAILRSPTGQVRYSKYESYLRGGSTAMGSPHRAGS